MLPARAGRLIVSFENPEPRHEPKLPNQPPTSVHSSAPKCLCVNPMVRRKPYFSDSLMSMIFMTVISKSESDLPSLKHGFLLIRDTNPDPGKPCRLAGPMGRRFLLRLKPMRKNSRRLALTLLR